MVALLKEAFKHAHTYQTTLDSSNDLYRIRPRRLLFRVHVDLGARFLFRRVLSFRLLAERFGDDSIELCDTRQPLLQLLVSRAPVRIQWNFDSMLPKFSTSSQFFHVGMLER